MNFRFREHLAQCLAGFSQKTGVEGTAHVQHEHALNAARLQCLRRSLDRLFLTRNDNLPRAVVVRNPDFGNLGKRLFDETCLRAEHRRHCADARRNRRFHEFAAPRNHTDCIRHGERARRV